MLYLGPKVWDPTMIKIILEVHAVSLNTPMWHNKNTQLVCINEKKMLITAKE